MIQLINKLKKNQKGFTLVELIVVLVILAILAAFTIPAMLGFIDDAKGKAAIAQGREIYVAAQSAATEIASSNNMASVGDTAIKIDTKTANATKIEDGDGPVKRIAKKTAATVMSDIPGIVVTVKNGTNDAPTAALNATVDLDQYGKVIKVQYVDASAKYRIVVKPGTDGTNSAEVEKL